MSVNAKGSVLGAATTVTGATVVSGVHEGRLHNVLVLATLILAVIVIAAMVINHLYRKFSR